jgi:uncharacterized protein (TIGR00255 family)
MPMIQSMTAFAGRSGAQGPHAWTWDLRGVNARGLDLRLRLPEAMPALEATVRAALSASLARGSITLNLRLTRLDPATSIALDEAHLDRVLAALARIAARAGAAGLALAPPTAADILAIRGVAPATAPEPASDTASDTADDSLATALRGDLDALIADFIQMRRAEGAALADVIAQQLDRIEALVAEATTIAESRRAETRAALRTALRRVFEDIPEVDEARLAQELALLAVRSDVTEELDRLTAHVAAARALLHEPGPQGRKLDFLAQEFNREANTLCSKAQSADLTRAGLDLKAVIDQMREQIQNVE